MVSKHLIIIAMLLCSSPILQAQECVNQLLASFDKLARQCDPERFDTYHASYSLEQQSWKGERSAHRFDTYSNGTRNYLFSDEYSVCADESMTVSVQKPGETIYVGRSINSELRKQGIARVMQQQMNNIQMLELQSCEQVEVDGRLRTRLVMSCPERYRSVYQVHQLVYEFDADFIYEVSVLGTESNPWKRTTYTIHRIETNQQFAQLNKAPTDLVFDANGKLLPEYSNYNIEQIGTATASTSNTPKQ